MSIAQRQHARRLAAQNQHTMTAWQPVPHVAPGDVYYSQCKMCHASLIWRSHARLLIPSVEGSALHGRCPYGTKRETGHDK
jgi:hypothetical protein